jgi:hypothetical protein
LGAYLGQRQAVLLYLVEQAAVAVLGRLDRATQGVLLVHELG